MKTTLIICTLLWVAALTYFAHGLENLNNADIVQHYLQHNCELLSNSAGNQYWYECDKTNHNPGTEN